MALKIPILSRVLFANVLGTAWNTTDPLSIHLYKASHAPADADVLATYTAIEADFTGGGPQLIEDWTDGGLDVANRAIMIATGVLWERTAGSNDIYGYFVTDLAVTELWWAEQFAGGPFTVDGTTPFFFVVPRFTVTSEF